MSESKPVSESKAEQVRGDTHDFSTAVHDAETLFGSQAAPLRLRTGDLVQGGVMLPATNALQIVAEQQDRFIPKGAFLFVVEHGSPPVEVRSDAADGGVVAVGGDPDVVALLPTKDKLEVVRLVGTNANRRHSPDEIVTWLRELDRAQPFALLGVGIDFVEGAFLEPVRDPRTLARNVYSFCPDFWDQGVGLAQSAPSPQAGIAAYFKTERYFHFWWD